MLLLLFFLQEHDMENCTKPTGGVKNLKELQSNRNNSV